jgi:hypothetical protein
MLRTPYIIFVLAIVRLQFHNVHNVHNVHNGIEFSFVASLIYCTLCEDIKLHYSVCVHFVRICELNRVVVFTNVSLYSA